MLYIIKLVRKEFVGDKVFISNNETCLYIFYYLRGIKN